MRIFPRIFCGRLGRAALLALLGAHPIFAADLAVAAAADLRYALDPVLAAYRAANGGADVAVTYGSSGVLFAQLTNGAPFDVFLSADAQYPRQLAQAGLSRDGKTFPYAVGRLVVWVPASSPLDVTRAGIAVLKDPAVHHVAIANPAHAPYGRAAEAALRSLGAYDAVQNKLVIGENVSQAAQFAESGAADAGMIALSLALSPALKEKGRFWIVPSGAHPPLEQEGVVLNKARSPEAAERFRDLLLGPVGRKALKEAGFVLPGG